MKAQQDGPQFKTEKKKQTPEAMLLRSSSPITSMQNLQIETDPGACLENKLNFAAGGLPRYMVNNQVGVRDVHFEVRGKMYQDVPNLD